MHLGTSWKKREKNPAACSDRELFLLQTPKKISSSSAPTWSIANEHSHRRPRVTPSLFWQKIKKRWIDDTYAGHCSRDAINRSGCTLGNRAQRWSGPAGAQASPCSSLFVGSVTPQFFVLGEWMRFVLFRRQGPFIYVASMSGEYDTSTSRNAHNRYV